MRLWPRRSRLWPRRFMERHSTRQKAGASPERTAVFDPRPFLAKLGVGKSRQEYQEDEAVFSQGDAADAVFYLQSGKVKLTAVSAQAKKPSLPFCRKVASLARAVWRANRFACPPPAQSNRAPSFGWRSESMVGLLHQEPEFAERFLAYLLSRNIRMEADLVDHLFNSSEKRLARLLLLMANFGQESKPIPIIAKMSQETLAEMIGTTRSRVSFFHESVQGSGLHRLQRRWHARPQFTGQRRAS